MPELFVDTAGWGHLVDPSQRFHRLARESYHQGRHRKTTFVTTNYFIAELAALLTGALQVPRPKMIAFIDSLKTADHIEIVHVDPALDKRAWRLLKARQDKNWSLVDAASFVIMKNRGIMDAFTSDHHFEQAGFRPFLK